MASSEFSRAVRPFRKRFVRYMNQPLKKTKNAENSTRSNCSITRAYIGRLKEITNPPANQLKTEKTTRIRLEPAYLLWVVKDGEGRKYMGEGWACRLHRRLWLMGEGEHLPIAIGFPIGSNEKNNYIGVAGSAVYGPK